MGKPFKNYGGNVKDQLHGAYNELISAQSSLNMEPMPLVKPTGSYLSQTDYWVAHSMEHIQEAMALINNVMGDERGVSRKFAFILH